MSSALSWALLAFQVLFAIGALGTFVEFRHGRDFRNLLGASIFGSGALLSYGLTAWWPLFIAFGLLWFFKRFGFDPGDDHHQSRN